MAQPKYTIYKYVRFKDGSWSYCRAAVYANRTIKPDVVTVAGREEKHPEGNYYIACGGNGFLPGLMHYVHNGNNTLCCRAMRSNTKSTPAGLCRKPPQSNPNSPLPSGARK